MIYFFHVIIGGRRTDDLEGKHFETYREAKADAVENARAVLVDLIQRDCQVCDDDCLEIAGAEGQSVEKIVLESLIRREKHHFASHARLANAIQHVADDLLLECLAVSATGLGNVQLMDWHTGTLSIRAHRGFQKDFIEYFQDVTFDDGSACAAAMRDQKARIVDDVSADPTVESCAHVLERAGVKAVQSTPLVSRHGVLVGVVSTHFQSSARPTEVQMRAMSAAARRAADAILKLRADLPA